MARRQKPPAGGTRSLLDPASFGEALNSHRAEHGRGTSKWVAQEYGVSVRTAQRWLAGTQQPRAASVRQSVMAGADRSQVRIKALRQVNSVDLGSAAMFDKSAGRNVRRDLGSLEVDMSPVADLLERGGSEAEADALTAQIYEAAYFKGGLGDDYPLEIAEYDLPPEFM